MDFIDEYARNLDIVNLEDDGSVSQDDLENLISNIDDDISALENLKDNLDPVMSDEKTIRETLKRYNLIWENK